MPQTARAVSNSPAQHAWRDYLTQALDAQVEVVHTRSRRRPLQLRVLRQRSASSPSQMRIALHPFFDDAPPELRAAVVSWVRSGSKASAARETIDEYIRQALARHPAPAPRVEAQRTQGQVYDLAQLGESVRCSYFAGELASLPSLTWGRAQRSRTRRSLRLGSCDPDGPLVRIHPVLDQSGVPEFFVRFILFHELLHVVLPPQAGEDGRWVHHSKRFRERERAHPDYGRALEWERQHLRALLRSARSGEALKASAAMPKRGVMAYVQKLLFGPA